MLPITIDASSVINQFALDKSQAAALVETLVKRVTVRIYENWQKQASRNLKGSRQQYLQSLSIQEEGRLKASVVLMGKLPNMIENGAGAFDMKPGFMGSAKVKRVIRMVNGKPVPGWYLTIPFRHAVPTSLAENVAFANKMPTAVHAMAKKLAATTTQLGQATSWGGRLKQQSLPPAFQSMATRASVSNLQTKQTFAEYQHKSSIYAGMVRNEKTYEGATQSTYMTFRRVSDKSAPNAWINKGIRAQRLLPKALAATNIPQEIKIAKDQFLADTGF
jgi:hypothetical protein